MKAATPPRYLTIAALAEAVHDGLADADDEQRAVMEKVREISLRQGRPHLTLAPPIPPESDAS